MVFLKEAKTLTHISKMLLFDEVIFLIKKLINIFKDLITSSYFYLIGLSFCFITYILWF